MDLAVLGTWLPVLPSAQDVAKWRLLPPTTVLLTSSTWSTRLSITIPWQIQWHSQGWEWEACHQWEALHHLPGARSCLHQIGWCWFWVCCGVYWRLHQHRVGPKGSSSLTLQPMPPCLWWVWTMRNMTAPSRYSAQQCILYHHLLSPYRLRSFITILASWKCSWQQFMI